MNYKNIFVASSSQSRKELARQNNLDWKFIDNKFDEETFKKNMLPKSLQQVLKYTKELAYFKALSIVNEVDGVVIGCDSVGLIKGKVLEKPKSIDDFYFMVNQITRCPHYFVTGVAIIDKQRNKTKLFNEITKLYFDKFNDEKKNKLLYKYNGLQHAGGYTLNSDIEMNTHIIKGTRDNVIGLPIKRIKFELNNL